MSDEPDGATLLGADVLDQLPATIGIFTGPDLVVRYANPLYAALAGDRELLGRPVAEVFAEPENRGVVDALRRVYETGDAITGQEWSGVAADPDTGRRRTLFFDFAYVPLRAADGEVVGAMVHAIDVTRLVEGRRQAEVTVERLTLLQRATAALTAALSPADVGQATVAQAMSALGADGGSLGLVDDGEVVLVHDHGYEPEAANHWRRFAIDGRDPLSTALIRPTPIWLERREDWAPWPTLASTIQRFQALAVVPLIAADRVLGAIALSFAAPRVLDTDERGFLLALADLAAAALDRARLYEERAYVARTLQAGLLPERLDEAPGLEVAVRYHSIADGGEVGGDFYDFFAIGPERWVVAVGDVSGKGSAAAALTGLARHTLRAIATREASPQAMLAFLNEALRRQSAEAAFVTVGCGTLERRGNGFAIRLASGGHPYPLLVRAGVGAAEEVVVRGTLLGVEPDPELEEVELELRPGDLLVLRTDGVEDARGTDGQRFGEDRVVAAVGAAAGGSAEAAAAAVDAAVDAHEGGRPRRDDRAIVVLRVAPAPEPAPRPTLSE
jgi:serine phosphatase RsbU (regulator of sigma subunit)